MIRRSIRNHPGSAAISSDRSARRSAAPSPEQQEILRADAIREQFRRGLRHKLFDQRLFGEAAWDILLALYVIDSVERRLSIAQLTTMTQVPLTTALRWLACLEEQDLVSRSTAPGDQRIVLVELTDRGRRVMESYFEHVREAEASRRQPSAH
jgi:DNA-binding MarR family transcriptional regulator